MIKSNSRKFSCSALTQYEIIFRIFRNSVSVSHLAIKYNDIHLKRLYFTISLNTPAPQYQPMDRKKRMVKTVEDKNGSSSLGRPIKKH